MNVRLQVKSGESRSEIDCAGPVITIGRNPDATLPLDGVGVSWDHVRIDLARRRVTVCDLQSTNGTYLNGEPLTGRAPLKVGDRIRLGQEGPRIKVLELASDEVPVAAAPLSVPSLLDVPTRDDRAGPAAKGRYAHSTTYQMLVGAIGEQKRQLRVVTALMLLVCVSLAIGVWGAFRKANETGEEVAKVQRRLDGINDAMADQSKQVAAQMAEHKQFIDQKFVDAAKAEAKRIEGQLAIEGKLGDVAKQMASNVEQLNLALPKNPAVAPVPVPAANAADAPALAAIQFKPGERIDLLMKNGQTYGGTLVYLSSETATILSNPNAPERPATYDMSQVQAIQTRDGIVRYDAQAGGFVSAVTSYRFNKNTATFDRTNQTLADLFLTENVRIDGVKAVNGLLSLGDYGELTISLPLSGGPSSIPAYQLESLTTSRYVLLFDKTTGDYMKTTHKEIAQGAKDHNDINWRKFIDERYQRNMEGYEAATRRLGALSSYWGRHWWWW